LSSQVCLQKKKKKKKKKKNTKKGTYAEIRLTHFVLLTPTSNARDGFIQMERDRKSHNFEESVCGGGVQVSSIRIRNAASITRIAAFRIAAFQQQLGDRDMQQRCDRNQTKGSKTQKREKRRKTFGD
jgi:hypothetical protein